MSPTFVWERVFDILLEREAAFIFFFFFSKKTIIGFEENFWRWDKLWEVKRGKFETFVLLYSIGYITCFAVANYIMIVIA